MKITHVLSGSPCPKDIGLRNLPLMGFAQNQAWCEIVALACEFLAWIQMLALDSKGRRWERKRLRLPAVRRRRAPRRGGRRLRAHLVGRWL